jgi:hypothetical protein
MRLAFFHLTVIVCGLAHDPSGRRNREEVRAVIEKTIDWKSPSGELYIDHEKEVNLVTAMYAAELQLNLRAILFSQEADGSGKVKAEGPSPNSDDARLYLTFKEDRITDQSFGDELVSVDRIGNCAYLMAAALGAEVDLRGNLRLPDRDMKDGRVERVIEFVSRKEDPYRTDGKVDVGRYLESKFLHLHVFIARALSSGDIGEFYNRVYGLIAGNETIRSMYFTTSAEKCTRNEKGVLEIGELFYECRHHGEHNTVQFIDEGGNAILSFLCSLLYNPEEGRYTLSHISDRRSELFQFFANRKFTPFKMTPEILEEWNDVLVKCVPAEFCNEGGEGEDRIKSTVDNIFKVLNHLCGVQVSGHVSNSHDFVCESLKELCAQEQQVQCTGEIDYEGDRALIGVTVLLALPDNRHIEVKMSCKNGQKRFEVKELSCAEPESVNGLASSSLTDFMIKAYLRSTYKNRKNEPITHPKALYFVGHPGLATDRDLFAARVLDAILLCVSGGEISEIRRRMHGLLGDTKARMDASAKLLRSTGICDALARMLDNMELSNAFAELVGGKEVRDAFARSLDNKEMSDALDICHMHFVNGSVGSLGLDRASRVLKKAASIQCDNLCAYLLENGQDILSSISVPESYGITLRIALLGRDDLLARLYKKLIMKETPYSSDPISYGLCLLPRSFRLDEKVLRYLLDITLSRHTWEISRRECNDPLLCGCRTQMANFCVRLSEEEDLKAEDVKRIYDCMCGIWSRKSEHLLVPVIKRTYKKLDNMDPVHQLVLCICDEVPGVSLAEFLISFLDMLVNENLYTPYEVYLKMRDAAERVWLKPGCEPMREDVKNLLLRIQDEGLTSKDDELSLGPVESSLCAGKNPMNRKTLDEIAERKSKGQDKPKAPIEPKANNTGESDKDATEETAQLSPEPEQSGKGTGEEDPEKAAGYSKVLVAVGILLLLAPTLAFFWIAFK